MEKCDRLREFDDVQQYEVAFRRLKRVIQKTKYRPTILIATVLLCGNGFAQMSVVKVSGIHPVDSAKKTWYGYVENAGSIPIDAVIATFHCKGTGGGETDSEVVSVYDSDYWYVDKKTSISPGGKIALEAADPAQCPGNVDAVIFLDGHSEGDANYVDELYDRRRGVSKAIGPMIPLLDGIAVQQNNRDHAILVIEGLVKSAQKDLSMNEAERKGKIGTYNKIMVELRSPPTRHLPQVDEIMISDNVTREQAFAMFLRNMLRMWQTSLNGKLEPSPIK
jgi:hypothetical protein